MAGDATRRFLRTSSVDLAARKNEILPESDCQGGVRSAWESLTFLTGTAQKVLEDWRIRYPADVAADAGYNGLRKRKYITFTNG